MADHVAAVAGGTGSPSAARVSVDFNNLPRGARVSQEPGGTALLDFSMGYSLVVP